METIQGLCIHHHQGVHGHGHAAGDNQRIDIDFMDGVISQPDSPHGNEDLCQFVQNILQVPGRIGLPKFFAATHQPNNADLPSILLWLWERWHVQRLHQGTDMFPDFGGIATQDQLLPLGIQGKAILLML